MAIVSLQSGLCDTLSTIGKSLKKRGTIKKALQKAGLFTECQEDIEAIKTEIKKYITTTLASCSASRRRKRSTGKKKKNQSDLFQSNLSLEISEVDCDVFISASITCAQITNMGASVLSSLSTSQLSGIQDADFTQCVNLLGSPTDYSTEQKEALVQVAKRPTVSNTRNTDTSKGRVLFEYMYNHYRCSIHQSFNLQIALINFISRKCFTMKKNKYLRKT